MSDRKTTQDVRPTQARPVPATERGNRARRKTRAPRVRLTHFEVRRGETLRLRIAVADEALAEVGDELGALLKRAAPSTRVAVVQPTPEIVISREHTEHDAEYHAQLRGHLANLFGSLCDAALDEALEAVRRELNRRAEGAN